MNRRMAGIWRGDAAARCAMALLAVLMLLGYSFIAQADQQTDQQAQAWPTAPTQQPAAGPGSSDYSYDRVRVRRYGSGADTVWLFAPAGQIDRPLPVILYVHGMNLPHYRVSWLWIEHLVKRGNLVIYPQYQQGSITNPKAFTDTTAKAARLALSKMDGDTLPKADRQRFAMLGHSLGGIILMNLAARHEHFGLPQPKALMPIQPGDVRARTGLGALMPKVAEDHTSVPADTLLLIVATVGDRYVGRRFAYQIYHDTARIDPADKDLLILADDTHGRPILSADHFLPLAYRSRLGTRRVDAYDLALWRWFDALCSAAFHDGKHRSIALGNTPEQRDIGRWSDGQPIRPPMVLDPEPGHWPGSVAEALLEMDADAKAHAKQAADADAGAYADGAEP